MTENNSENGPIINPPTILPMRDPMLVTVANAANRGGHGVPITIFVNGNLVSGWTVSGKDFLDQFTEKLGQNDPDRVQSLRNEAFAESYELYDTEKNPDFPPSILHLIDVVINNNNSRTHIGESIICRFRIDNISGFYFGAARGIIDDEHQGG